MCIRAAHHDHTSQIRWVHSMVALPMLLQLSSTDWTDSGWDGQHPSNTVSVQPSSALDGVDGSLIGPATQTKYSNTPQLYHYSKLIGISQMVSNIFQSSEAMENYVMYSQFQW